LKVSPTLSAEILCRVYCLLSGGTSVVFMWVDWVPSHVGLEGNSAAQSIRNIKSALTFKRHLKTHLFKCAYNRLVDISCIYFLSFYFHNLVFLTMCDVSAAGLFIL